MGKPKDKGHLSSLFNKAEQTCRAKHKTCLKSIDRNSDTHSELADECNDTLEQDVTELRQAFGFLKQYYFVCDLGIKCSDSYAALGLRGGDKQVINAQYRTLTKNNHPDLCKRKDEVCREVQDQLSVAKKFLLAEGCADRNDLEDFFVPNIVGADSQSLQEL
jgi:hypothetical protein